MKRRALQTNFEEVAARYSEQDRKGLELKFINSYVGELALRSNLKRNGG